MNPTKTTAQLARLREQITAMKSELADLDNVMAPREEANRSLNASIDSHAERGRLSVASVAEGRGITSPQTVPAFDLLCWIAPDLVRQRFSAELDRFYEGVVAMDAASVDRLRSKLEAELFDLEVAEERPHRPGRSSWTANQSPRRRRSARGAGGLIGGPSMWTSRRCPGFSPE